MRLFRRSPENKKEKIPENLEENSETPEEAIPEISVNALDERFNAMENKNQENANSIEDLKKQLNEHLTGDTAVVNSLSPPAAEPIKEEPAASAPPPARPSACRRSAPRSRRRRRSARGRAG